MSKQTKLTKAANAPPDAKRHSRGTLRPASPPDRKQQSYKEAAMTDEINSPSHTCCFLTWKRSTSSPLR